MPTCRGSPTVFEASGVVVGLQAEARIARRLGLPVEVGGGGEGGAEAAAERLIRAGARGLISFGLAGGLSPEATAGTVLVPDLVLSSDGPWPTDPLLAASLGRVGGALFAGGQVLATPAAKAALHASTGAAAIDLESAAVARAASRHALPFAALRAVCDPAGRPLPAAALAALDARGRIGLLRVAVTALCHPAELRLLLLLSRDAFRARAALHAQVDAIRRVRASLA